MFKKSRTVIVIASVLFSNFAMAQETQCFDQDFGAMREVNPGVYELSGNGETRKLALQSALVGLSYGIHTKVQGECTDIESHNSGVSSHQSCSRKFKTRSELGYTPIVSDIECGSSRVVTIRYDSRPLVNRFDISKLQLKPDEFTVIDESQHIPFTVLLRNIRSGLLSFDFDEGNRIWIIRQESETIWLTSKSLLDQIHWNGCEIESSFELVFGSGLVDSARDGQEVRVKLSNKDNRRFASIWELSHLSGAQRIGRDLNPELEIDNGIIELDFSSSLVRELIFVLLLTDEPLQEAASRKNFTIDQFVQEVLRKELLSGNGEFCAYTVFNKNSV